MSRSEDSSNAVDEALSKFKSSNEFATLLKKDHDTGFDDGVEAIFYNIWTHYRDLDYAHLGGELIDLVKEWIEEERLHAYDVVPSSAPPGPSIRNAAEIEMVQTEISKQPLVVEVDEMTATSDPSIALEVPVIQPSLRVAAVQSLINLEEELVATDDEEEPEAAANPSTF